MLGNWSWFPQLKEFGESLGWVANIVQVAGLVSLFSFGVAFWRERRAYARRRKMLELEPAGGAVAMAIGVGTPIEATVRQFLRNRFGSTDGALTIPLISSHDESGFIPTRDFLTIVRKIRNDVDELRKRGDIREVHLFYAGPYAIAAGIGAIMDNWVPVHVYMYNTKTSEYELAFTLSAETVKGI